MKTYGSTSKYNEPCEFSRTYEDYNDMSDSIEKANVNTLCGNRKCYVISNFGRPGVRRSVVDE